MSERQATRRRGRRVPPCADGTRSPICEALDRPSQVPQSSPSWPRPQALAPSAGPSVIARKARDRPYPRSHDGGPDNGHPGLHRSALSRRAIARAEVSAYLSRDETRPRDRGPAAFRRRIERAACSQALDRVCSWLMSDGSSLSRRWASGHSIGEGVRAMGGVQTWVFIYFPWSRSRAVLEGPLFLYIYYTYQLMIQLLAPHASDRTFGAVATPS